jgi:hypothetical protein
LRNSNFHVASNATFQTGLNQGSQSVALGLLSKNKSAIHHNDGRHGKSDPHPKSLQVDTFKAQPKTLLQRSQVDEPRGKVLRIEVKLAILSGKFMQSFNRSSEYAPKSFALVV